MAESTQTYAKLSKPPQFKPDESVTMYLEYSTDLLGCTATLKVYGYSYNIDGTTYTGTEQSAILRAVWLGTGYEEFVIPANILGKVPETSSPIGVSGQMQAVVEISKDTEDGQTVVMSSNIVGLNMLLQFPDDFQIVNAPIASTASTKDIDIRCVVRSTASGDYGINAVNSYCVLMYDSQKNLVRQSDEMFDWENSSQTYITYKLRNLQDKYEGYVQVRASLAGGYNIYSNMAEISVNYATPPETSENIKLSNRNGQVKIEIVNMNGTLRISRSELYANEYLTLLTYNTSGSDSVIYDNYAISGTTYIYKVERVNGNTVLETRYAQITHVMNGVHISDITGAYHATVYDTLYPVTRNDRPGISSPMDSVKPVAIINGLQNNDNGSINALFSNEDECNLKFDDNTGTAVDMRKWLNNGKAKLLKYDNGEAWIVTTTANATNKNENGLYYTSFNWEEIGDVKDINDYIRLGLV